MQFLVAFYDPDKNDTLEIFMDYGDNLSESFFVTQSPMSILRIVILHCRAIL